MEYLVLVICVIAALFILARTYKVGKRAQAMDAAWAIDPMNPKNPLGYLYVGGVNFDQDKFDVLQPIKEQA